MPADAYVMDADMKKVADAIRAKGATTAPLTFPDGMVQAVNDIQAGGGGGQEIEDELITRKLSGTYTNNRITAIGDYGFAYCRSLRIVEIPNVTSVGNSAFEECGILNIIFPNIISIGNYAFAKCYYPSSIDLPNITSIGNYAFYACNNTTSINVPKITSAGNNAFQECRSLKSIDLPNLTLINSQLFKSCYELVKVNVPKATEIRGSAFESCSELVSLDFPNVTRIGHYAFTSSSKLKTIKFGANQVAIAGVNILSGSNIAQIYVPDNLVEQYKVATNWSQYASRIHPMSEAPPE